MQRKYLKINRKQFSLLEGMVVKHSFDGYIIICRDSRENEVLSPVLKTCQFSRCGSAQLCNLLFAVGVTGSVRDAVVCKNVEHGLTNRLSTYNTLEVLFDLHTATLEVLELPLLGGDCHLEQRVFDA